MHFANQPLIGSETGTLIVLKHPYPHEVEEPSIYESVRVHTAMQTGRTENDLVPNAPSLGTKEGYLIKQGKIVKNWKTRWFTLHRNELKYFKDQTVSSKHQFYSLNMYRGSHNILLFLASCIRITAYQVTASHTVRRTFRYHTFRRTFKVRVLLMTLTSQSISFAARNHLLCSYRSKLLFKNAFFLFLCSVDFELSAQLSLVALTDREQYY
ncbi:dual adapter for phosphotyrosine and 3-phosphotyrosine and 3-phosphoinositide isoform X4 [Tympanuchus pallidicinctus]|nr:dual adapter for phosphotyrosine and 3-phosphotyrosine and 3-phosphoinositide isoform X4 [Tympanuchus pallidicinctus]